MAPDISDMKALYTAMTLQAKLTTIDRLARQWIEEGMREKKAEDFEETERREWYDLSDSWERATGLLRRSVDKFIKETGCSPILGYVREADQYGVTGKVFLGYDSSRSYSHSQQAKGYRILQINYPQWFEEMNLQTENMSEDEVYNLVQVERLSDENERSLRESFVEHLREAGIEKFADYMQRYESAIDRRRTNNENIFRVDALVQTIVREHALAIRPVPGLPAVAAPLPSVAPSVPREDEYQPKKYPIEEWTVFYAPHLNRYVFQYRIGSSWDQREFFSYEEMRDFMVKGEAKLYVHATRGEEIVTWKGLSIPDFKLTSDAKWQVGTGPERVFYHLMQPMFMSTSIEKGWIWRITTWQEEAGIARQRDIDVPESELLSGAYGYGKYGMDGKPVKALPLAPEALMDEDPRVRARLKLDLEEAKRQYEESGEWYENVFEPMASRREAEVERRPEVTPPTAAKGPRFKPGDKVVERQTGNEYTIKNTDSWPSVLLADRYGNLIAKDEFQLMTPEEYEALKEKERVEREARKAGVPGAPSAPRPGVSPVDDVQKKLADIFNDAIFRALGRVPTNSMSTFRVEYDKVKDKPFAEAEEHILKVANEIIDTFTARGMIGRAVQPPTRISIERPGEPEQYVGVGRVPPTQPPKEPLEPEEMKFPRGPSRKEFDQLWDAFRYRMQEQAYNPFDYQDQFEEYIAGTQFRDWKDLLQKFEFFVKTIMEGAKLPPLWQWRGTPIPVGLEGVLRKTPAERLEDVIVHFTSVVIRNARSRGKAPKLEDLAEELRDRGLISPDMMIAPGQPLYDEVKNAVNKAFNRKDDWFTGISLAELTDFLAET